MLMRLMVPWYFSYVPVETISGGIEGFERIAKDYIEKRGLE